MENNHLLSKFSMAKYEFKNNYTAGKTQNFSKPCIGYVKKGYAKFLYKGQTIYANSGDLIYIALGTQY